jgi:hypothetical protein
VQLLHVFLHVVPFSQPVGGQIGTFVSKVEIFLLFEEILELVAQAIKNMIIRTFRIILRFAIVYYKKYHIAIQILKNKIK